MANDSVVVFGSSKAKPGSPAYALAHDLGVALGRRGVEVRCGGYSGVMEGLSAGAREGGGRVVGCTLDWFGEARTPNAHLHEEQPSTDLAGRLRCLLDGARAAIVLPGGVGTLNELFWTWTLLLLGRGEERALVLLGEPWAEFLEFLSAHLEFDAEVRAHVRLASGIEEAVALACGGPVA